MGFINYNGGKVPVGIDGKKIFVPTRLDEPQLCYVITDQVVSGLTYLCYSVGPTFSETANEWNVQLINESDANAVLLNKWLNGNKNYTSIIKGSGTIEEYLNTQYDAGNFKFIP